MENKKQKKILHIASLTLATVATFISLSVLAAWSVRNPALLEKHYWIFYMQHTTAFLFFISSIGLFILTTNRQKAAMAIGAFVFCVAAAFIMEYAAGLDLHIDQFLMQDYAHPDTLHPGRPAPNTALAFLCIGLAEVLLAINQKSPNPVRMTLIELVGFIIFALGAHAIGGYLQSVEAAYAWGTDTRMSVQTALANIAVGSGLLTLSWQHQKKKIAKIPLWAPSVICFLALQADLISPPGIIISLVYIPLVFCSLWFTFPRTAFLFAFIATLFALLRYFMLPKELMTEEILINRLLVIGVIWFIAFLVFWQRVISRKLERSDNYLRAIVDYTLEGLIVIDEKGKIKNFNRACEKIFGYKSADVINKNINVLMPEPYHNEHDDYIKNYLTTGQKKIIGIGREVRGRRQDGTEFPMDLAVSEMIVEGERFFSGIVRDITERKQAEEELLRSNTELERFAFVAAHDLQEPLRAVTTFSEFLEEDYADELDEEGKKYIQNMRAATKRMRDLVKDLLEYSRIGNEERQHETLSLQTTIQMALNNLETTIQKRKAQITTTPPMPEVTGNPVQLLRLFQNLIGNALKYRQEDKTPVIEISADEQEKEWVICIRDNGIGMEKQYLEQIFIPFKRLHNAQEYPGTGIGLAMCKRIVESHSGRIWAESEPGQGSAFFFTLPKLKKQV